MSISVTFNGTTYSIPQSGETEWGDELTNLLADVAGNAADKTSTQVLTNKTLTAPVVTNPTVTTGTFTTPAITTPTVTGGTFGSPSITSATVTGLTLNTGADAYTFPTTRGTSAQVLTTDGAGSLTWTTPTTGTVTQVSTGTGLTGGPITGSGTVALADTAVTPGTYTLATVTVDQQGRVTAASNGSAGSSGLDIAMLLALTD